VDDYSRECLALEVDTSITGRRVVVVLERLGDLLGLPLSITVDHGPGFEGPAEHDHPVPEARSRRFLWGINSFDQWVVELGKKLCEQLAPAITDTEGGRPASPRSCKARETFGSMVRCSLITITTSAILSPNVPGGRT